MLTISVVQGGGVELGWGDPVLWGREAVGVAVPPSRLPSAERLDGRGRVSKGAIAICPSLPLCGSVCSLPPPPTGAVPRA